MHSLHPGLNVSQAARNLGVSVKALRLYEKQGLVAPERTAAGYRIYAPADMGRAREVVALRALGLSLAQVAAVLEGDALGLQDALGRHQAVLDGEVQQLVRRIDKVQALRADLARGRMPADGELPGLLGGAAATRVSFPLPWPWGGELFESGDIRPLTYLIGSLGSGKTRLARRLAEALPSAVFLGPDRLEHDGAATVQRLQSDPAWASRVRRALRWLVDEGGTPSRAAQVLLAGLEAEGHGAVVIDMPEQGLDASTQEAVIAYLRQRAKNGGRPVFMLTRSSAVLDLSAVGPDEAILLCPANHSPPFRVAPYPGAPGYEAVALCLATPAVRERLAGGPDGFDARP